MEEWVETAATWKASFRHGAHRRPRRAGVASLGPGSPAILHQGTGGGAQILSKQVGEGAIIHTAFAGHPRCARETSAWLMEHN